MIRFGSVCSGIEAASCAWGPLGFRAAFVAEIEPFCCALLKHHYPEVPNHGDFTSIQRSEPIDVLVGGTPCQSFSVAGKRAGLDDPRGNLTLEFLALAGRLRPRWVVWENVPGVMSDDGGRTFGTVLGLLGQLGYGFAYRILDAQYFGVPQRRRRVFVVGHLGDWRSAAAVLFERHCLQGNLTPSRKAGERIAPTTEGRAGRSGELSFALNAKGGSGRIDAESETFIARTQAVYGFSGESDGSSLRNATDLARPVTGRHGDPGFIAFSSKDYDTALAPIGFYANDSGNDATSDGMPTLRAMHGGGGNHPAIAFDTTQITSKANVSNPQPGDPCHPLASGAHAPAIAGVLAANSGRLQVEHVTDRMAVRRLTPRECERLQGFRDDYTAIPYRGKLAADGPRYRALGNSMAVPVMSWIGRRILEQSA